MRTRIKFCGITRAEDARAAVQLGADAVGLVRIAGSPRCVPQEQAAVIRRQVPAFVQVVAVLENPSIADVNRVLRELHPDLLQFHGDETPEFCARFGVPFLKAVPMAEPQDLGVWGARFAAAAGLLLDGHGPGARGGQGRAFDWCRAQADIGKQIILAGGLTPDNVAEAVRAVRPYAVDVSTGIEELPGFKDFTRMKRFVDEVRAADAGI